MIYIIIILAILSLYLIIDKIRLNRKIKQLTESMTFIMNENLFSFLGIQTTNPNLQNLAKTVNEFVNKYRDLTKVVSQLDQDRKDLIANISHDIRTPLTSIMGYLEVILDGRSKLTKEEEEKYLSIVYEKSRKLGLISRDFFNFSQLEANKLPGPVEKIQLNVLIQDLLVEFYYEFEKKGISLRYSPPNKEIIVLSNKLSLERIINNLIENALFHGSSGKFIGIDIDVKSEFVVVQIWDKGEGISPEDLPHIFKRLYQANSSRENEGRGNGLGLTICKELVERQGGTIQVSSIPYEKTTFTFTIPLFIDNKSIRRD
ncbi:sensor histidine kinase [Priestia megaterium]|uniref:sensor histidine kinase n=1 Tax=Priestia megaterium TaxID=1404 RepID=UPI00234ED351|nr:HAMP domain-containing sensor histidine kinase [Priestia megaterium]MDC7783992.1 HAMP domain-containing sensor histidine kinase [Priestia megaterium]